MKKTYIIALFALAALMTLPKWNLLPVWRRDFVNVWLSGQAAQSGVDPYDLHAFFVFAQNFFPEIWLRQTNFTYPPHALFLFTPFSLLPPVYSIIAWSIASLAFFYWAARPLIPKGMSAILALLTPAGYINLIYGQTGLISAGLFLLAFRPSGIAAALLTFKPHMGFLVIPALVRSRKALLSAIMLTGTLVVVSAVLLPDAWPEFMRHAVAFQGEKVASGAEYVWWYKATTPMVWYGLWGWLLYAAGAAYFLIRNYNVFTAATATFLISPYGFHYDMAAVCLGFAVLLYRHWDDLPVWQRVAASLAFMAPVIVDYGTWLISPILLVGLFVQSQWREDLQPTDSSISSGRVLA